MIRIYIRPILVLVCCWLTACGGDQAPVTYTEAQLPTAVPVQFQGWWKGKTEWDYFRITTDGLMEVVFPQDFKAAFDPNLTTPSTTSYLKVIKNEGDTLYAIAQERRYDRATRVWSIPVYFYVKFRYDFQTHELTYIQQPCRLTDADYDLAKETHLQRIMSNACTDVEETPDPKLRLWRRELVYVRA